MTMRVSTRPSNGELCKGYTDVVARHSLLNFALPNREHTGTKLCVVVASVDRKWLFKLAGPLAVSKAISLDVVDADLSRYFDMSWGREGLRGYSVMLSTSFAVQICKKTSQKSLKSLLTTIFMFFSIFAGSVAFADEVILRSENDAFVLDGTLLGFDGEFYRIDTKYGELTVDGSRVSCEGQACPSISEFVAEFALSGESEIGNKLMPGLVEGFAKSAGLHALRIDEDDTHFEYVLSTSAEGAPVGRFRFRASTTEEGFADLLANEADVAMATREVRPVELARTAEIGLGRLDEVYRSRVLALDALIVIVSPSNQRNTILMSDLTEILSGKITNWSLLDGPNAPIEIHMRDTLSGGAQAVEDWLVRAARSSLSERIVRHSSDRELIQAVEQDPFALGIVSYSAVRSEAHLGFIGPCGLSVTADRLTIKSEDYPLTAPLFLYIPARRLPKLARDFLKFTRTSEAQEIIERAGYVDQRPQAVGTAKRNAQIAVATEAALSTVNLMSMKQGFDRISLLARAINRLDASQRFSTSFRFKTGTSRLDAQSLSTVYQLSEAIRAGSFDGNELTFVGFTDGQGSLEANLRIAKQRALRVKQAVEALIGKEALSNIRLSVDAFGPALPMACDNSAWGRKANRRVEVWVQ